MAFEPDGNRRARRKAGVLGRRYVRILRRMAANDWEFHALLRNEDAAELRTWAYAAVKRGMVSVSEARVVGCHFRKGRTA